MPDDPAFIRMVAAGPDDDAPRLVYADYLEETGDPAKMARAEFIRVQVEKARLVPDTPRWTELWHRDSALLDWAKMWRRELPAIGHVAFGGFIRGFIDTVDISSGAWSQCSRAIIDAIPLRKLRLNVESLTSVREVARSRDLVEVAELEILQAFGLNSPSVLRAFSVRGCWPKLQKISVLPPPVQAGGITGVVWRKVWEEFRTAFGYRVRVNPRIGYAEHASSRTVT